jgi:hypothetical protein
MDVLCVDKTGTLITVTIAAYMVLTQAVKTWLVRHRWI